MIRRIPRTCAGVEVHEVGQMLRGNEMFASGTEMQDITQAVRMGLVVERSPVP